MRWAFLGFESEVVVGVALVTLVALVITLVTLVVTLVALVNTLVALVVVLVFLQEKRAIQHMRFIRLCAFAMSLDVYATGEGIDMFLGCS